MGVAFAAPAAFGHHQALAGGEEVAEQAAAGRKDPGSQGDWNDQGGAVFAVAVLALAPAAVFRLEDAAAPEIGQGAKGRGGFEDDVAPGPAVAAVRAAHGLEPGPEEADTARAAAAGPDRDVDLIRKGFQVWG